MLISYYYYYDDDDYYYYCYYNNYCCCCMAFIDSDRMKKPAELKRHNYFQTPSRVLTQFQVALVFSECSILMWTSIIIIIRGSFLLESLPTILALLAIFTPSLWNLLVAKEFSLKCNTWLVMLYITYLSTKGIRTNNY